MRETKAKDGRVAGFLLTFYRRASLYFVAIAGVSMDQPIDLLQGTLDLLVLRTLAIEPMHGWGIAQRIQQISRDVLKVQQGSLYPALHRLERRGWVASEWQQSDNNRRSKYYSLTRVGRKQLERETAEWGRLVTAVALVLES
jgi:PadR family transcriptional regulator, regulatory protein PadR